MTVKAKRAQSLRKMPRAEADTFSAGCLVDESVPLTLRDAIPRNRRGVDLAAFEKFLGSRLGLYRELAKPPPSPANELSLLDEAIEAIEEVRTRLESLPPQASAIVEAVCWKSRRELFSDLAKRLDEDLNAARSILFAAWQEIESKRDGAGAPLKSHRDSLLHDAATWLQNAGMGALEAAGVAAAVLRKCGIPAPDDPKKAREIVRKLSAQ